MGLRFVIGPPGSGKTHWCLERARTLSRENPDGPPVVLLVPEQASYQTEAALLSAGLEGTARVRVLSFARLANWIWSEGPSPALPRLGETHRRALVTTILARMRREGGAETLTSIGSMDRSIAALLSELKHHRVRSGEMVELADRIEGAQPRLAGKLRELAKVATAYDERIRGRFQDPEETLAGLRETIVSFPELQGARIFADGFAGFTPVEMEVLRGLMQRCTEVCIALDLEESRYAALRAGAQPNVHGRFLPTEETLRDVLGLAADDGIEIEKAVYPRREPNASDRYADANLRALRDRFLASHSPVTTGRPESVAMETAADVRDEARRAVEHLLAWHVEKGWAWSEMAIVTRNLEPYAVELAGQLEAARIPWFVDRLEPLETHPVVQGVSAALAAVVRGFRTADILDFARSGLHPFDPDDVARLAAHAQAYPPRAGQWRGREEWTAPPSRSPFEDAGEHEALSVPMERLDATRRDVIAPLEALAAALEEAKRGQEYSVPAVVQAICHLIQDGFAPETELDEKVLREAGELLGQLCEAGTDEALEAEVLLDLLHETFGKLTLPRIPPALGRVIVGAVERSRFPALKGVVVLGLSEGSFPAIPGNSTLLTDSEREALTELEPAETRRTPLLRASSRHLFQREAYLGLVALTRASERLVLLRPRSGGDGGAATPSPFWSAVQNLFPAFAVEEEELAAPPALSPRRTLLPQEAAALVARESGRSHERRAPFSARPLYNATEAFQPAFAQRMRGVLDFSAQRNQARLDPALASELLGKTLRTSVSALESYAACPFRFFMERMIAPETPPEPRVTAADLGNLAHATLKSAADWLIARGHAFNDVSDKDLAAALDAAFDAAFARLQRTGIFDPGAQAFGARMIREQIDALAATHHDATEFFRFRPIATERRFGDKEGDLAAPRYTVDLGEGRSLDVVLRGVIDRIDLFEPISGSGDGASGYLAVFDYKLTARQMDWAAAAVGQSLQLPVYLAVLRMNAEELGGAPDRLAGAFYIAVINRQNQKRRLRGVVPASARDALGLAERGSPFSAGGKQPHEETPSTGDLISDAQFDAMIEGVEETIARHARGMIAGTVDVRPAVSAKASACTWCGQRLACRLDYTMNNRRMLEPMRKVAAVEQWLGPPGGGGVQEK